MKIIRCCLVLCYIIHNAVSEPLVPAAAQREIINQQEKKLSDYVLTILDHYKEKDPVGIPGAPIPDPLLIPKMSHSFSVGQMHFKDMKLYGLKKFRIRNVKADIAQMKLEAALTMDKLKVIGNYTLSTWLSRANGPFTVNLTNVVAKANATLEIERSGKLEAQEISMDITFESVEMDFKGLGFFASVFQGMINSVGDFIFDSIKPFVLKEVNTNMRNDINKQVQQLNQTFPNSIAPFDQLVSTVRHKIRSAGYDPFKVNDYNNSIGLFDVYMRHTWLYGLSSIHRVGDIQFEMVNNTIYTNVYVGTQRLKGTSNWELALIAGLTSRSGQIEFTVEYVRVQLSVSQSMDTRNSPKLEDIQLELGNIQIRFDGMGTVDYAIEFAVNVLPNILRYQIMDALETPLKLRVQEVLNTVNVEKLVKDNVKKLDDTSNLNNLL